MIHPSFTWTPLLCLGLELHHTPSPLHYISPYANSNHSTSITLNHFNGSPFTYCMCYCTWLNDAESHSIPGLLLLHTLFPYHTIPLCCITVYSSTMLSPGSSVDTGDTKRTVVTGVVREGAPELGPHYMVCYIEALSDDFVLGLRKAAGGPAQAGYVSLILFLMYCLL